MVVAVHQIAAVIAGIASHIGYFNKGEHHLNPARYVVAFAGLLLMTVVYLVDAQGVQVGHAASTAAWLGLYFLAGLYTSLVIYRLFLHPLNRFPGPLGARISGLWLSAHLTASDPFRQFQKLHNKHGHFVRVGPSDLSISHPKAVNIINGSGSKCTKGFWYDITVPTVSLQTCRVRALHDQRRRIWSAAFGDKALRGYEQRIRVYRQKLMDQLAAFDGQPVNITKWVKLYSFDVMGDLAFGRSFNMVASGAEHWAVKLLDEGLSHYAFMFPMWFLRLVGSIPGLTRRWWKLLNFCNQSMDERMKTKVDIPDISSALLDPLKDRDPSAEELAWLHGDAQLIVIAGSDTTASALASIVYELVRHPDQIDKLREELAPYMTDPSGEFLNHQIANLDHLNAIIYEALRLYPPVPTAFQRLTPPEGIEIDGTHIPGNMIVYCPQYVIGRCEAIYPHAEEFIPERWYKYPDMVKERSAYAPFSTGPFGCIGRPLALLNLRTTIARLVTTFDFDFAPGEDGHNFIERAVDHITLGMGELKLSFKKRCSGKVASHERGIGNEDHD